MGRFSWSYRSVIEYVPRITIQELKAWDLLKEGKNYGILVIKSNGEEIGYLKIIIQIYSKNNSFIEFEYLLNGKLIKYYHKIELFFCYFGGHRFYFICRDTNKRVTVLYLVGGYFSSRHFHELVYQCSREHRSFSEFFNKSYRLRKKAKWLEKIGHPIKASRYYCKAINSEYLALAEADKIFNRKIFKLNY